MKISKLIKSAAVEANFLAAISMVTLLVKIFIFNKYPSWHSSFFDIGVLFESILASIVAGYIFYIFINHLQEIQKNKVVAPFILKQSTRIVGECRAQLIELSKASNFSLELSALCIEEVNTVFSKLRLNDKAPLIMKNTGLHATWIQFFEHHIFRTNKRIRKLLDQLIYIPPTMIVLVSEIEDSSHFSFIPVVANKSIENTDLTVFAKPFFEYCVLCKNLDIFNEKYKSYA